MRNVEVGGREIEIWRLNAFTDEVFTGNPAGVVPDADGLSEELMQSISAELNSISETVFICKPDSPEAEVRLRYFTSTTEVDLCGHATISALFTLSWLGRLHAENGAKTVKAQTNIGVLELGLEFKNGKLITASMEQLKPELAPAPGADIAAQVLGLQKEALADNLEIACCSTGIWACFVPLKSTSELAKVNINRELIEKLWPENPEFTGVYAFAFIDGETTQGRFFSPPKYGIVEDPATGTASGALGGYLIANGLMPSSGMLTAYQGVEMGRKSKVVVSQNENGHMCVHGQAVPVINGKIFV